MKEYEIVAKFRNACAGNSRPQTFFEEAEIENPDDFIRRCRWDPNPATNSPPDCCI